MELRSHALSELALLTVRSSTTRARLLKNKQTIFVVFLTFWPGTLLRTRRCTGRRCCSTSTTTSSCRFLFEITRSSASSPAIVNVLTRKCNTEQKSHEIVCSSNRSLHFDTESAVKYRHIYVADSDIAGQEEAQMDLSLRSRPRHSSLQGSH